MKPFSRKPLEDIDVWRADELGGVLAAHNQVLPSGHAALDAELPGGGWPLGALIEVLQTQPGNDWRLVLPALCALQHQAAQAQNHKVVVLVGAAHQPFAAGLGGQGFDAARLLCVQAQTTAQRLWATEQALRCKDVAAVLAWLPHSWVDNSRVDPPRVDQLRRLQIAAADHHKLLFVWRPAQAQAQASPAQLRVLTSMPAEGDALQLHILKRRGPSLERALTLVARPVPLSVLMAVAAMRARAALGRVREVEEIAEISPISPMAPTQVFSFPPDTRHALDRPTAAA